MVQLGQFPPARTSSPTSATLTFSVEAPALRNRRHRPPLVHALELLGAVGPRRSRPSSSRATSPISPKPDAYARLDPSSNRPPRRSARRSSGSWATTMSAPRTRRLCSEKRALPRRTESRCSTGCASSRSTRRFPVTTTATCSIPARVAARRARRTRTRRHPARATPPAPPIADRDHGDPRTAGHAPAGRRHPRNRRARHPRRAPALLDVGHVRRHPGVGRRRHLLRDRSERAGRQPARDRRRPVDQPRSRLRRPDPALRRPATEAPEVSGFPGSCSTGSPK